jgi:hypothetical protein
VRQVSVLPDIVVRPARDGPLILAGSPGRLRGELHITNAGAERARLHGFVVRKHDLPAQPAVGQLGGRLPPGASGAVTASLALAADTPPGEYHATLDIAGHEIIATLHVSSSPSLELTPSRIFVEAGMTSVRLVARNTGNARQTIASYARARLRSDPDLSPLSSAVSETDRVDAAIDAAIDAAFRLPATVTLDPGDVLVLDAEVEVGGDIDRDRRYLALLPVAAATLRVIVGPATQVPDEKPASPAGKPKRNRATRPARPNSPT